MITTFILLIYFVRLHNILGTLYILVTHLYVFRTHFKGLVSDQTVLKVLKKFKFGRAKNRGEDLRNKMNFIRFVQKRVGAEQVLVDMEQFEDEPETSFTTSNKNKAKGAGKKRKKSKKKKKKKKKKMKNAKESVRVPVCISVWIVITHTSVNIFYTYSVHTSHVYKK